MKMYVSVEFTCARYLQEDSIPCSDYVCELLSNMEAVIIVVNCVLDVSSTLKLAQAVNPNEVGFCFEAVVSYLMRNLCWQSCVYVECIMNCLYG